VSVFGVQVGVCMWALDLGCWVVVVVVGVEGSVASSGWCWGVGGGGGGWLSGRERERVERGRVNSIIYFYLSAVNVLYHIPRQIPLPVTEVIHQKDSKILRTSPSTVPLNIPQPLSHLVSLSSVHDLQ